MVKKIITIGLSVLISLFLIWYFAFKQYDYTISFKIKAATGTVFQGLGEWRVEQAKIHSEKSIVLDKLNFNVLKYKTSKGLQHLEYTWNINVLNDSVTQVEVGITEPGHSLYNRLTAPFWNTNFKVNQIEKVKSFKDALDSHIKNFKIKIDGDGISKETYVAYITLKSVQQEKARAMIGNDNIITGFLYRNNIKIIGRPYVEILKWDVDHEKLEFNYCFPIDKKTQTIVDKEVKFKTIPSYKGLKATYYGNFRTSDRAWFALLDYAKKKNIELDLKPLENFLDNPFNGGEETSWQTKIIIPYKTQ